MYIKVEVNAEAKRNSLKRLSSEKFRIDVKDKAKNNLANRRALSLLAEHLQVPAKHLRIMHGHTTAHKIVSLRSPPK